jgi:DNA repair protein RadA/Sms
VRIASRTPLRCAQVGVFSMAEAGLVAVPNPSAAFLGRAVSADGVAAAVTVTCEGTRPMLLEIQALCAPVVSYADKNSSDKSGGGEGGGKASLPAFPARRSATGVNRERLHQLLAVLSKRALGPGLYAHDVFVNVVGGLTLDEPAADLALCAAVGAAFFDTDLPGDVAFIGEVGLGGELRAVPQAERRIAEAARLGFTRVIVPVAGRGGGAGGAAGGAASPAPHGCRVVPCDSVAAALAEALGPGVFTDPKARRGRGGGAAGADEGGGAAAAKRGARAPRGGAAAAGDDADA